jgi:hypothetical protein
MKQIQMTQGYVVRVPDDQYDDLVAGQKWYPIKRKMKRDGRIAIVYARRSVRDQNGQLFCEYMHRRIMRVGRDPKVKVDHIDGDGLNNTYENLRVASHAQNIQNCKKQFNSTSQFKGVSWRKDEQLWVARIQVNGKSIFLHYHKTEEGAARAYDKAALQHFGEFAKLNFGQIIRRTNTTPPQP